MTIEMYTLRTARDRVKLTQKDAAEKLGISPDTLRNWENGITQPDALMIKRIEELYHINFNQLIFLNTDYGKTVTETEDE